MYNLAFKKKNYYFNVYKYTLYLVSNLSQNSAGTLTTPIGTTSNAGSGILWPSGTLIVKFCKIAARNKNSILRVKVSPGHVREPTPNGREVSDAKFNFPVFSLMKRLGLKVFASLNIFSLSCAICSTVYTMLPLRRYLLLFWIQNCMVLNLPVAHHSHWFLYHALISAEFQM